MLNAALLVASQRCFPGPSAYTDGDAAKYRDLVCRDSGCVLDLGHCTVKGCVDDVLLPTDSLADLEECERAFGIM